MNTVQFRAHLLWMYSSIWSPWPSWSFSMYPSTWRSRRGHRGSRPQTTPIQGKIKLKCWQVNPIYGIFLLPITDPRNTLSLSILVKPWGSNNSYKKNHFNCVTQNYFSIFNTNSKFKNAPGKVSTKVQILWFWDLRLLIWTLVLTFFEFKMNKSKTRANSIPRIWVLSVNVTYIQ